MRIIKVEKLKNQRRTLVYIQLEKASDQAFFERGWWAWPSTQKRRLNVVVRPITQSAFEDVFATTSAGTRRAYALKDITLKEFKTMLIAWKLRE